MCCEVLNNVILEAQIDEFFHLHSMANIAKYRCGAVESVEEGALTNDLILMEGFMDNLKTTLSNVWTAIVQIFHEIKEIITKAVKTIYYKIKSWVTKNDDTVEFSTFVYNTPQELITKITNNCNECQKMFDVWDKLYKSNDIPTENDISAFEFNGHKLETTTDNEGNFNIESPSVRNKSKYSFSSSKAFKFRPSDAVKFSEQLDKTSKVIAKLESRAKNNCRVKIDNDYVKTRYMSTIALFIAKCISEYIYDDYEEALNLLYKMNEEINKNGNA